MNSTTWPLDARDEIGHLARLLAQAHFDVMVALVGFNLEADTGDSISDSVYTSLFIAIGKLQRASVDLRIALLSYRTTSRLPTVRPGE